MRQTLVQTKEKPNVPQIVAISLYLHLQQTDQSGGSPVTQLGKRWLENVQLVVDDLFLGKRPHAKPLKPLRRLDETSPEWQVTISNYKPSRLHSQTSPGNAPATYGSVIAWPGPRLIDAIADRLHNGFGSVLQYVFTPTYIRTEQTQLH